MFDFSALQRAEIAERRWRCRSSLSRPNFSALQRAEIAEIYIDAQRPERTDISVLFNEPKLLKKEDLRIMQFEGDISVLFNEPKLLKCAADRSARARD